VNGRGPYKFVLDTGSNITLFESSLFHELELKPRGTTSAKAVDGMWLGKIAYVREISIEDGVSQSNVRVLEVDGMKRPDMDVSVRGVLGEDFLHAFDLLIDNEHQLVTFDRGNVLASKLAGDHEPISSSATVHGVEVKYRPLLWAIVPSIDANRPLHLLVDTGIEERICCGARAVLRMLESRRVRVLWGNFARARHAFVGRIACVSATPRPVRSGCRPASATRWTPPIATEAWRPASSTACSYATRTAT
jgi:hypothetical protein